jgi:hypothetical protein
VQAAVVGRVLESDLRLAEVSTVRDQFQALSHMAGDLQAEALRLAREGSADDLLLVGWLYERVVCTGLAGRARVLSPQHQQETLPPVVKQLQETAETADRIAEEAPADLRNSLRAMGSAAREASQLLMTDRSPARPPPSGWVSPGAVRQGTPRALLGALVMQGLRLAETDDPLRRADCCSDIADNLVQTILVASATGDTEQASWLGKHLGEVMDRGVERNLARAQVIDAEGARKAEVERVSQRSAQATAALERNLERAPAAARAGLQRALEASGHGERNGQESRGKGKGKNKGKGKGNRPAALEPEEPKGLPQKGKSTLPPGLEKKFGRDDARPSKGKSRGDH